MERYVLFTDEISKVSLEKIERTRQSIRKTLQTNLEPATTATP